MDYVLEESAIKTDNIEVDK
ncbi:hypothetical protein LINPERPRIM_LOCUS3121 [Linum perenne]